MTKIAVFYGGKITKHLVLIREAARKLQVDLRLVSYNLVSLETETGRVSLRGEDVNQFDVIFFRTTGKHGEEVDLINEQLRISNYELKKKTIIVDPLVLDGKPSQACKAWQMWKLREAGIPVPKTVYGSLWYLYETMGGSYDSFLRCSRASLRSRSCAPQKHHTSPFIFPIILKGSGGDRGTRVFKADNLAELETLIHDLRKSETEEGKRYMLQEYIENQGDYRVLVLGEKVLGVMKRYRQDRRDFRNNFSVGGEVKIADLPDEVKDMSVKAAKICGLMVAGVDIILDQKSKFKNQKYKILEVNKGPQFWGFMKATGIDVPAEIVKFLINLSKNKLA